MYKIVETQTKVRTSLRMYDKLLQLVEETVVPGTIDKKGSHEFKRNVSWVSEKFE